MVWPLLFGPAVVMKARVLVVDDDAFAREGIRSSLRNHEQFVVVGEAATREQALEQAQQSRPDIVVMDLNLPVVDGLQLIRSLRQKMPEVKPLVLIPQHRGDLLLRAHAAGAAGCLGQDSSPRQLITALAAVYGEVPAQPGLLGAPQKSNGNGARTQLSFREVQVLTLLGDGFSNREVAGRLGISVRTVEKHRENILETLGMHNIADLVRFAVGEGLVKVTPASSER